MFKKGLINRLSLIVENGIILPIALLVSLIFCLIKACISAFVLIMIWCLEILLLIPFFIIWIATGKFYGFKMEKYVEDNFKFFKFTSSKTWEDEFPELKHKK